MLTLGVDGRVGVVSCGVVTGGACAVAPVEPSCSDTVKPLVDGVEGAEAVADDVPEGGAFDSPTVLGDVTSRVEAGLPSPVMVGSVPDVVGGLDPVRSPGPVPSGPASRTAPVVPLVLC